MVVRELIALLQKADPDAEVFFGHEQGFDPMRWDGITTDEVTEVACRIYRDDPATEWMTWVEASHPWSIDASDPTRRVARRCQGVLFGSAWPKRLDGKKSPQ